MTGIEGKRIAILVASGSDQAETTIMREVLSDSGSEPVLVSVKKHEVRGWKNTEWGDTFPVDVAVLEAQAADYDGLIVPGGVIAADTLRADGHAIAFARGFLAQGKAMAALGHAPWLLVEVAALKGRSATSIHGIRLDLINAGARWVDEPAVRDGRIVTGRTRHDLPDLMARFVEAMVLG